MNHKFKKQFGQNFLRSARFPQIMANALNLEESDLVIEIGPGAGILTGVLLQSGAYVNCIEVDYELIPNLIKRFGEDKKFSIINEDILTLRLEGLIKHRSLEEGNEINLKITGSLPYNISKEIIAKFIKIFIDLKKENLLNIKLDSMSFILQDEVAKSYSSKPPKASFLSNYIRLYTDVKKLESIPASQFFPKPKVDGGILLVTFKEDLIENHQGIKKAYKNRLFFTKKDSLQ
ncbi:MAG: rRNA adenine N-6-methyltransferase family protein [Candidatus Dojkabacteria bacterium]|nr:rRNA adenine N-6-methyltransferase family protein [Candidatus Dojkabacteria bacterium]